MCGLAGILGHDNSLSLTGEVGAMVASLAHRGPDDEGVWVDVDAGIALGHRRLSILDLSLEGHQPMLSGDGRYVMVFNGEIYNFEDFGDYKPRGNWEWLGKGQFFNILLKTSFSIFLYKFNSGESEGINNNAI